MKELVRVANTDIHGNKPVYHALRRIQGVSYAFSNAVCNTLHIDKNKKIGECSDQELKHIEDTIKTQEKIPPHLTNRQKDRTTGKDKHLISSDLKLQKEFDIRALKKVKSYRGMRHAFNLPVRGQRTQGNFRKGSAVGVQKKKAQQQSKKQSGGKK